MQHLKIIKNDSYLTGYRTQYSNDIDELFMIINQTFIFKCLGDSTVAISAFMVMIDATDTLFKIGVLVCRLQNT